MLRNLTLIRTLPATLRKSVVSRVGARGRVRCPRWGLRLRVRVTLRKSVVMRGVVE